MTKHNRRMAVHASVVALCFLSCARSERITPIAQPRPMTVTYGAIAGYSVQGREISYHVIGQGPRSVMIMATIHGNEAAGTALLHRLRTELENHPGHVDGRTVVLVPCVNPDGYAAESRYNARGVDLNRNFPSNNHLPSPRGGREPLSEPESQAVTALIDQYQPRRIISIHQPLACIDYDGNARALAEHLSKVSALPLRKLGTRPGSMGSWVESLGDIACITLELPSSASRVSVDKRWADYGETLLAAIKFDQEG